MESARRNAVGLLLGGAMAASAVLLLVFTAELTFFGDTWSILINRRDFTADALFAPHNEHIVVLPVLIEQFFLRAFGMSSSRPEYVLLVIGLLITVLLLFVYVRRRVGPWPALFAAALVLFLGPAWEVLLWPFEIGYVGSVLFGLAMLLALERDERRADVAACLFLVLSLGFSSLGIPFLAAGLVAVIQAPRQNRWRRAYVVAIPAALFAIWYLGWGNDAESHLSLRNVLASPRFVVDAVAVAVGCLFGLGPNPIGGGNDLIWGRALLVALVLLIVYRKLRHPGFFPGLWPVAAAAGTNWFLTAFNLAPGRDPTASRYQYAGAIFVLLILANLFQGARPSRRVLAIAAIVTVAAVGPNLVVLKDGSEWFEDQSVLTRSNTAAIEIARRTVNPDFQLTPEVAGTPSLIDIVAGKYLEAVDEYGSPAYSPGELNTAPQEGRRQADIVLSQALPLSTFTRPGAFSPGGGENCIELPGGGEARNEVPLSSGLTRIELAPGPGGEFSLRRFAVGEYPVETEGGPGGSVTELQIPADAVRQPWYLNVESQQPARVCR